MSNAECRMTNERQILNDEFNASPRRLAFVIGKLSFFSHSSLVIRHWSFVILQ